MKALSGRELARLKYHAINEMFGQPFDLLLGRKTSRDLAAHWPYGEGGDSDFVANGSNSVTKYVGDALDQGTDMDRFGRVHDASADVRPAFTMVDNEVTTKGVTIARSTSVRVMW